MPTEQSPFSPGRPIGPDFFIGRINEISRLIEIIRSTSQGKTRVGFISGERGIGKSSIANMALHIAERNHGFVGCNTLLGGVKDTNQAIRRLIEDFINSNIKSTWHSSIKDLLKDKIHSVGAFGVTIELNLDNKTLSELSKTFIPTIEELWKRLEENSSGIVLIWDDINGMATSEEFANWLKSTVDTMAFRSTVPLCMLFVGLEERKRELVETQPSLDRILEPIEISTLSRDEAMQFYKKTFESYSVTIDEDEIETLAVLSGGLPVLMHELGEAVWLTTDNSHITKEDVNDGIFNAATTIGKKYLRPRIYDAIQSENYRSILRKIATMNKPQIVTEFKKSEVSKTLSEKERRVFGNFINRMKKLGIIESDAETRGGYKFPENLYTLYFHLEAIGQIHEG